MTSWEKDVAHINRGIEIRHSMARMLEELETALGHPDMLARSWVEQGRSCLPYLETALREQGI